MDDRLNALLYAKKTGIKFKPGILENDTDELNRYDVFSLTNFGFWTIYYNLKTHPDLQRFWTILDDWKISPLDQKEINLFPW